MRYAVLMMAMAMFSTQLNAADDLSAKKDTAQVWLGLRAGLNLSNVWGIDSYENQRTMLFGIAAGLTAPISLREWFIIEPGIHFTTKGTQWQDPLYSEYDDAWKDVTKQLNYVEIPVMLKFVLPTGGSAQPFLSLGAGLGIMVVASRRAYSSTGNSGARQRIDIKDDIERFDPSAIGGCGMHITAGQGYFVLEARLTWSFLSHEIDGDDVKNWCGTASIGYVFNLKRKKTLW